MDITKRIVKAYLNSAEGYFHTKRKLQDGVKQDPALYGPMSDRPEGWDYLDVRDIEKKHLFRILTYSLGSVDWGLYSIIPSTALNAALQTTIDVLDYGKYKSKIDANVYEALLKMLAYEAQNKNKIQDNSCGCL